MNEKYVISLELAKRLKALGVKQESEFFWAKTIDKGWNVHGIICFSLFDEDEKYSAYHVGELGEMLPYNSLVFYEWIEGDECGYGCELNNVAFGKKHIETALSEAEARGLMFEYLIKEGLVEP